MSSPSHNITLYLPDETECKDKEKHKQTENNKNDQKPTKLEIEKTPKQLGISPKVITDFENSLSYSNDSILMTPATKTVSSRSISIK